MTALASLKGYLNHFNSDETTNNITILNEKLPDFLNNKPIIPSLLLKIINDFNDYLNKININNKNDADNLMIELLKICIDVYNNLKNKTSHTPIINIIANLPEKISTNLENIIKCFHYIYKNHIEIFLSNSVLTYYFAYLIYKCILIYYTYTIYIKNIIKIFNNKIEELKKVAEETEEELGNIENVEFSDLSYIILGNYRCTVPINNFECMHIEIIYRKIINKFNIDILGDREEISDTISINYIYNKMGHILKTFVKDGDIKEDYIRYGFITDKYIDNDSGLLLDKYIKNNESMELYKKNIYKYIIKNYNVLKLVKENIANDFITIPQYTGICWFSSILTGMCYSDNSRNLLNSKIGISHPVKNTSDTLFIDIVREILKVSTNFLRYGDDLSTHCDLFKFFKYKLTDYLMARLNEVKKAKAKENDGIYTKQDLIIGDNEYYYINKLNMILETNAEELQEENITKIDKMGITANGTYILESLYNILGIKALFIISNNAIMHKKKSYNIDEIPEIIIVETISNHEVSDLIEEINILDYIKDATNDEFTYKNHKYKLDYMLYSADSINNVCTKEGCGHCVSSIHYNGEQYYYDSGNARKTIDINSACMDDIRIPCSLIRQDWISSSMVIDDKKHFYMNECFYREADITLDSIKIEYKVDNESSALFSKEDNIISVYVKVDEESDVIRGGKNTTYKSTHKKVNIKNKTIIERIVYIDKNKNKYIKFNKKYELLSTFKYNRKNKYYYI